MGGGKERDRNREGWFKQHFMNIGVFHSLTHLGMGKSPQIETSIWIFEKKKGSSENELFIGKNVRVFDGGPPKGAYMKGPG